MFEGHTDIRGVNLAKAVTIAPKFVDVYPSDDKKPPVGEKLNKSAVVTLEGLKNLKGIPKEDFIKKLKHSIEPRGGEHIYYCHTSCSWEFRVPNFD